MGLANYHYYEDLAGSATHTPTAQSIATFFSEAGTLKSDGMHFEYYTGSEWKNAHDTTPIECSRLICQDNAQNMRIANELTARKISLTGVTWS